MWTVRVTQIRTRTRTKNRMYAGGYRVHALRTPGFLLHRSAGRGMIVGKADEAVGSSCSKEVAWGREVEGCTKHNHDCALTPQQHCRRAGRVSDQIPMDRHGSAGKQAEEHDKVEVEIEGRQR